MKRGVRAVLLAILLGVLGGVALTGCGDDESSTPLQPKLGAQQEKPGADRPTGAHGGSNN